MAAGRIFLASAPSRTTKRKSKRLATVKQVKNLIARNVNKDEKPITTAGGTVVTAGALYNLVSTTDITGDAKIDSLSLRYSLTNVTNANQLVRVIIFQFKQSTAVSNPSVGQVLDTASPLSSYVENVSTQCHILSDRSYTMNLYDKSMITVNHSYFKRMINFKNNATSGLDGGTIWMLVIGTVNTNTTLSSMYTHVKYHETD